MASGNKASGEKVYERVRNYLQDYIKNNPAGTKLPTYIELNEILGAKQSAVERVLQELSFSALIDRIPRRGVYISENAKKSYLGVVFGYGILEPISSPFWSLLMMNLRNASQRSGFAPKTYIENMELESYKSVAEVNRDMIGDIETGRVKGFLIGQLGIYGVGMVEYLSKNRIPLVSYYVDVLPGDVVRLDLDLITQNALKELAQKGCQRVMVISVSAFKREGRRNMDFIGMIQQKCSLAGLDFKKCHVSEIDYESVFTSTHMDTGEFIFKSMMDGFSPHEYPDGILVTDDMILRGILPLLGGYGLKPSENIHVAALTNKGSPILMGYEQHMIRLEVDPAQVSALMLELLQEQFDGRKTFKNCFYHPVVHKDY